MSSILLTGSSGRLGRAVSAYLAEAGHDVHCVDRTPPATAVGTFARVDLTDYGQVSDAMAGIDDQYEGIDAVVHLAAIPAPGVLTDSATFHHNMNLTYNVFQAARRAGVKKIVCASSETTLGLPFAIDPPYLPVDEEYPARPESTYSLVKHLEEQMAIQMCRWDPELSIIALRFSNVMHPEDYAQFPSFDADPASRRWNLWGYIDARDGAQAVDKALAYAPSGFECFVIANADTVMSRASADLAADVFPTVRVTKELGEHETLLSIDRARRLLGYEPKHSWRDGA